MKCPRCRGTGKATVRDFYAKVLTGQARYSERMCPECKGSGRVEECPPRPPQKDDSPF